MPTSQEVAHRLFGAWRLLRGDRGGMAFFDGRTETFWGSFFAAVLVAPAYLIKALSSLAEGEPVGGPLQSLVVHLLAYVIGWTAFPVAFHAVIDLVDRRGRYTIYIVAFNWSKVIQMALFLPVILFDVFDILGEGTANSLTFVITLVVLGYQWFVTRTALDVSGTAAAGIVSLDVILGLMIALYANAIIF